MIWFRIFYKLAKRDEDFLCSLTNEHIITKKMIEEKATIIVHYDNEKRIRKIKLDPYERTIEEFTYIDVDLTVVEILPEDAILNEYFLLPAIHYMYNFEKLEFEKITIIQYPNGKLNYSSGKIENIDHYTFSHLANTDIGSSGSPIFLKNTPKVIGIYKSTNKDIPINYGNFIGPIYKYFIIY